MPGGVDPLFCETTPVPPMDEVQLVTALVSVRRSTASMMILRCFRKPNGKRIRPQNSGINAPVLFRFMSAAVEPVVICTTTFAEFPEATTGPTGLMMHAAPCGSEPQFKTKVPCEPPNGTRITAKFAG